MALRIIRASDELLSVTGSFLNQMTRMTDWAKRSIRRNDNLFLLLDDRISFHILHVGALRIIGATDKLTEFFLCGQLKERRTSDRHGR